MRNGIKRPEAAAIRRSLVTLRKQFLYYDWGGNQTEIVATESVATVFDVTLFGIATSHDIIQEY